MNEKALEVIIALQTESVKLQIEIEVYIKEKNYVKVIKLEKIRDILLECIIKIQNEEILYE